ncbi:hypothetical protein LXL04_011116 [Taraxacum kok-saghyz]
MITNVLELERNGNMEWKVPFLFPYLSLSSLLSPISFFPSLPSLSPLSSLQKKKSCFTHTTSSMDDDGLNMRNWGYYEPSFKEHLGLQLMSPLADHRDTKPFLSSRENPLMMNQNGGSSMTTAYHHRPQNCVVSEAPIPLHYMRDSWIQRERLLHMLPGNPNFSLLPDASASSSMHMMQPIDLPKEPVDDNAGVNGEVGGSGPLKKRSAGGTNPKPPRAKKPRKPPAAPKENGNPGQRSKVVKRSMDVVINGVDMDISGIPIPVCSCTGTPQQCYRWGSGGWQSACCTTTISMYPLPMSTKRRGARIAGRKMSNGAFKKVLEKLASEGYNFANAIDLRLHWAKHGTNKCCCCCEINITIKNLYSLEECIRVIACGCGSTVGNSFWAGVVDPPLFPSYVSRGNFGINWIEMILVKG